MPLFRRPDGDVLKDLDPIRRMMPYLMPRRNDSVIYHISYIEVAEARAWLRNYNRNRGTQPRATLFHLLVHACAKMFYRRLAVNRFVAGGRIYQRKGVWISFAAKIDLTDDAPLATVKLNFPENETFDECVKRITEAIHEGRSGRNSRIDREVRFLTKLPGPLLRMVIAAGEWLDRWNLLPGSMIDPDPMYTSMFLANLGSLNIDSAYHHLYEYGTCGVFGAVGTVKKITRLDRAERQHTCDVLQINWTLDERINDAFYYHQSMAMVREFMENPGRYFATSSPAPEETMEAQRSRAASKALKSGDPVIG